ncbi:MAG: hypothetical protein LBS63_01165 [Prevotellaceae bacterium]|nr:hypothetical protein [Prevotellaceae bacterium]
MKHTITVALCLLITVGTVRANFYLFTCAHCATELTMDKEEHGCCHSSAPVAEAPCGVADLSDDGDSCCEVTLLSVAVAPFKVAEAKHQAPDVPVVLTPDFEHCVDNGGSNATAACLTCPREAAPPTPIIYLHRQLRL